MEKNILTNLHLKIASLVLALFLWVYVANVVDPWQSKTISNIPITFINTEVLTENSKTFSIAGSSNASVTVKVRSANYSKITASNFTAVIDCSKINDLNGAVKVEITYDNEFLLDEIRYNTDTVRLSTEDIKPYTYQLQATITGEDRIMEGYKLGDKTVDPGSVTITAPVSVLNDIYSAGVVLDVQNLDLVLSGRPDKCFDVVQQAFEVIQLVVQQRFLHIDYDQIFTHNHSFLPKYLLKPHLQGGF